MDHEPDIDQHADSRIVSRVFAGLLIPLGLVFLGLFATATPAAAAEEGKYWGCGLQP